MATVFYGPWLIRVPFSETNAVVDEGVAERLVVTGSDTADGHYAAALGREVVVQGDEWTLGVERRPNGAHNWQELVTKRSTSFTREWGLTVTIEALSASGKFVDLRLRCRYLDPVISPPNNAVPLSFTLTENQLQRPSPSAD